MLSSRSEGRLHKSIDGYMEQDAEGRWRKDSNTLC